MTQEGIGEELAGRLESVEAGGMKAPNKKHVKKCTPYFAKANTGKKIEVVAKA